MWNPFLWCEVCGLCPLIVGPTNQAGAISTPWNKPSGEKIPSLAQENSCVCSARLSLLNSYSVRIDILFRVGKKITQGRVSVNIRLLTRPSESFVSALTKNTGEFPLQFCFLFVFLFCFLPSFLSSLSNLDVSHLPLNLVSAEWDY